MKKLIPIFLCLYVCLLKASEETLVVYTYSSLTGKGSLSELLQKEWGATGKKMKIVSFSTSGEALNQVLLEKEKTQADIVLGIDQLGITKAQSSGYFLSFEFNEFAAQMAPDVPKLLSLSGFVPFDYGYLAFVYDSTKVKGPYPDSFEAFVKQKDGKKVILIDPRTSQLGLSFLCWTKLLWQDKAWTTNMKLLQGNTKLWAPGWSAAYSLFQKAEADYVLSYTTSPAYHIEEEKKDQFKTLNFKEGHLQQIETAAIVKNSKKRDLAIEFLKILLSKRVQDNIPKLQWMYPVVQGSALPASFNKLEKVKALPGAISTDEKTLKTWLNTWNELIYSSK